MLGDGIQSKHVFLFLFVFWTGWVSTEISEYFSRDEFYHEVNDFMYTGERFTAEDGEELEQRIEELEEKLSAVSE